MPQKTILLDNQASAVLTWTSGYNNLVISQNNQEIAAFKDSADFIYGKKVILYDNQVLIIKVANGDLEAWHNNKELISNLASGQKDHYKTAINTLWGMGGIQTVVGFLLSILQKSTTMVEVIDGQNVQTVREEPNLFLYLGIAMLVVGLVYLGMAAWATHKRIKMPIYIALGCAAVSFLGALSFGLVAIIATGGLCYVLYMAAKSPIIAYTDEERVMDETSPLDQL
jgi:hypothetical protein